MSLPGSRQHREPLEWHLQSQPVHRCIERAGFQLQPFLIIGIISGVRHILTLGARLSLAGEVTGTAFRRSQIELGVEAAVVLGLGVALFLVRLRVPSGAGE